MLGIEVVVCCQFCFAILPSKRILQNQQRRNTKCFGCIEYKFWSLPYVFWTFTIVKTWHSCCQALWLNLWHFFFSVAKLVCWSFAFDQHTSFYLFFLSFTNFWPFGDKKAVQIIPGTPTKSVWYYKRFTSLFHWMLTIKSTKLDVHHTWDNLVIVNNLQTWGKIWKNNTKSLNLLSACQPVDLRVCAKVLALAAAQRLSEINVMGISFKFCSIWKMVRR